MSKEATSKDKENLGRKVQTHPAPRFNVGQATPEQIDDAGARMARAKFIQRGAKLKLSWLLRPRRPRPPKFNVEASARDNSKRTRSASTLTLGAGGAQRILTVSDHLSLSIASGGCPGDSRTNR